jgi:hypothetical protein
MDRLEKFEEKNISAYCRLSYEVWFKGYNDNVKKYLHRHPLDKALGFAAKGLDEGGLIKVDGVVCMEKFGLKKCIETVLDFLYINEKYNVVLSLPYEYHKEADGLAYRYIDRLIDICKFSGEMYDNDYLIMIGSITRKSDRYLKIHEDGIVSFAIYESDERNVNRDIVCINPDLQSRVIDWARQYIEDNKMPEIAEGMSGISFARYKVYFNFDKLGFTDGNSRYIRECGFETVEGNGVISELLELPELKAFIEEVQ